MKLRKPKKRLGWCPHCKEKSVRVKVYIRKRDGKKCRCEYCINKECPYKMYLPFPEDIVGEGVTRS